MKYKVVVTLQGTEMVTVNYGTNVDGLQALVAAGQALTVYDLRSDAPFSTNLIKVEIIALED